MVNVDINNAFEDTNIFEDQQLYDGFRYYDTMQRSGAEFNLKHDYGLSSTVFRGSFTLLIEAGFVLIQMACIPTWNVYHLLYLNLLAFVSSTSGFCLVGYFVSYGKLEHSIFSKSADYDNAVTGWCICLLQSTIVTVLLSGRLSTAAFLIVIIFMNYITLPLFLYWIGTDSGSISSESFMGKKVVFKDHSGCLFIHLMGSLIGLIGILFLGRRVMRISEVQECSMGPDAPGLAVIGYFFLIIGFIAMSLCTREYEENHHPKNYMGLVFVNNLIAAVGSMTIVILFGIYFQPIINYWYVLRIIQAGIAGMVMISAGTDVFSPLTTLGISVFSGFIFYGTAQYIYYSAIEDYCNIIAIHLIPSIIGILLPTLFGSEENLGFKTVPFSTAFTHLAWQFLWLLITMVIITALFCLIFGILYTSGFLQNKMEDIQHRRAKQILAETSSRRFFERIFIPKETSTGLLPGYESKNVTLEQYNSHGCGMNPQFLPNKSIDKTDMHHKVMTKNPFQDAAKQSLLEQKDHRNLSNLSIKKEPHNQGDYSKKHKTTTITLKSSSDPLLNIQSADIHRRKSDTVVLRKPSTLKYLKRPWNLHQKIRLYSLKKTEKICNLRLGNRVHNLRSLIERDDNYSETIDLNDRTVKIIKKPKNLDECYESVSESEV